MAKKCILNNWKYPPPEFFNDYFKRTDKLMKEEQAYNDDLLERQNLIRKRYEYRNGSKRFNNIKRIT